MAFDIIPRSFWNTPVKLSSIFDDEDWTNFMPSSGLSVSEDEKHVYIEAAVPGIDPDQVEVTYDKGVLWIKAASEQKEEDKQKKFYRRASSSFSYRVAVPGEVDDSSEPTAVCKNGVMKISFNKTPQTQPRKINVQKE